MELEEVVPWGRNLAEYQKMFSLTHQDLTKKILGCSDGPASFNAEWSQLKGDIISVDPLYQFHSDVILQRIEQTATKVMEQVCQHQTDFIWNQVSDPEALRVKRMNTMHHFLTDFSIGCRQGRYLPAALPNLPFVDRCFDLALCSHFLFLYSETLSLEFHLKALTELLRVASEVRIYPLVTLDNQLSTHLTVVISEMKKQQYRVATKPVEYQFQRGATEMLVITQSCSNT